jgi:hypothetical protein
MTIKLFCIKINRYIFNFYEYLSCKYKSKDLDEDNSEEYDHYMIYQELNV